MARDRFLVASAHATMVAVCLQVAFLRFDLDLTKLVSLPSPSSEFYQAIGLQHEEQFYSMLGLCPSTNDSLYSHQPVYTTILISNQQGSK